MKITGTFKSYDDLLTAYGTDLNQEIDYQFDGFLKIIADKDCVLVNYDPVAKTFDTTLLIDDPNNPGQKIQQMLDPFYRRYGENMGIDKLVDGSIVCEDCDQTIYCKKCGSQYPKSLKYDAEPTFTWGELYDGQCTKNDVDNKSGTTIYFSACVDGKIFCFVCRHHEEFDEVGNSF
jgi:hypothetical protein